MLSGAAIGLKAWSDYLTGQAQAAKYTYEADVQNKLASIAATNANYDIVSGEVKAQQAGLVSRAAAGRLVASAGTRNIGPTTGSTAQAYMSQLAIGQENQAVLRADAAHAAYGEQIQAAEKTAQAGLDVTAARTATTAASVAMAGDIVSGAERVAAKGMSGAQFSPTVAGGDGSGSVAPKWYAQTEAPGGPGSSSDTYIG